MTTTTPILERFIVLRGLRALTDDTGRIPLFATTVCAATFANTLDRLTDEPIVVLSRTPEQIAVLLALHDLDETAVYDFEATANDAHDALRWAVELAARTAARANVGTP